MKLTYTLTLADYIAAIRLHRAQSFARRFIFAILYLGLPILAVAGLVSIVVLKEIGKTNLRPDYVFAELVLLLLSIGLPIARIPDVRICFRRIFANSKEIPTITMVIDEECVRSEIPGVSEGKFFWNAIVDFAQNEKVTLLYVRKRAFLFFPTPILSPDQRAELNALVTRHVVKKNP
jgi:hypothetical protein